MPTKKSVSTILTGAYQVHNLQYAFQTALFFPYLSWMDEKSNAGKIWIRCNLLKLVNYST